MSLYILSPLAQADLVAIRDYYAGQRVARQMLVRFVAAFRRIARNPAIGHKREDLAGSRPLLLWGMGDYLIVYKIARPVEIVTILHGSRDIKSLLRTS